MTNRLTHRLIQLTDPHIGENREHRLAGICTYETFSGALSHVSNLADKADMLMLTGDLVAHGKPSAYELFADQMATIDTPFAWLPGNHDDFEIMQKGAIPTPYRPLLELGDWRIIMLNTAVKGQVGGTVSDDEIEFLDGALSSVGEHPAVIFMHHPPVPVGCEWLDPQRVSNADQLAAIISRAQNVKAVFSGHVHQEFVTKWAGTYFYSTPSTCFQFAANSADYAMSDAYPAYRWINLHADGSLQTGVNHIEMAGHKVDHQVTKY